MKALRAARDAFILFGCWCTLAGCCVRIFLSNLAALCAATD